MNPDELTNESLAKERERELAARLEARMMAYRDQVGVKVFRQWKAGCIIEIGEKYKNLELFKYRMYQFLIGGSGYEEAPFFDFPGECSVQKMIEDLPVRNQPEFTVVQRNTLKYDLATEKQLVARLQKRMEAYRDQVGVKAFGQWKEDCIDRIEAAYKSPERFEYRMYHYFIGGADCREKPFFDFPGKCSVQKMIEKLPVQDEEEK